MKPWAHGLSVVCLSALAGVTGPILFLLIMTVTGLVQPVYDPIQETISMLVFGPYGWLQTLVFFLFGFFLIVFIFRLYLAIDRRVSSRIGIASLMVIGLGFFLIGVFPTQRPGTELTLYALIHRYTTGAISLLFTVACFAFALGFRTDPLWKRFSLYTFITGVIALTFIILLASTPLDWSWTGFYERMLLLSGLLWITVVAVRLLISCLREWRKSRRSLCNVSSNLPR